MPNRRMYAILLALLVTISSQFNYSEVVELESNLVLTTAANNADPTVESLSDVHVEDDHFILPNNFTTLDFTITNSSDYIFAGFFSGTLEISPNNNISSNASSEDMILIRTDFNGSILNYFYAGGSEDDRIRGMDIDPFGNFYLGGFIGGNISLNGTQYITNNREGFVFKLDSGFNVIWSNNVTSVDGNEIADIKWNSTNSIAIIGDCNGTNLGLSFGSVVNYKRCDTTYTSNTTVSGQWTGIGVNTYAAKLNSTGDWQWAIKTEGCSVNSGSCTGRYLNVHANSIWFDSNGDIVIQGSTSGQSMGYGTSANWCGSSNKYQGINIGDRVQSISRACAPGTLMVKLNDSGAVKTLIYLGLSTSVGYDVANSAESALDDGRFVGHFAADVEFEHGESPSSSTTDSCPYTTGTRSISEGFAWLKESLCDKDSQAVIGGSGTVSEVSTTSGNSTNPLLVATMLGTGTLTLGSNDHVLASADTPVVAVVNTSDRSGPKLVNSIHEPYSAVWAWSLSFDNYGGHSIDGSEVSGNGDIHVLLGKPNGVQILIRATVDSDGDGVGKYSDKFPNDATQWSDSDNDGYGDSPSGNNPDGCVTQVGNSSWPVLGCPDYDGDKWSDSRDRFPGDITQWNDTDWDGYGDNTTGFQPDACPSTYGTSNRNSTGAINGNGAIFGCIDDDFDGFSNTIDNCPSNYGDSVYGINNGNNISYIGCSDSDRDGYADIDDPCSLQYGSSWLDRFGCPDADEDGISDLRDPRPNHRANSTIDWDSDNHTDHRTWINADGLQYWINGSDVFPDDQFEWNDLDSDGVGDNSDQFPNINSQYLDSDGDGYGDNSTGFEGDGCIFEWGNATSGSALGCLDSDGDGWADRDDAFDNDKSQWNDTDGDGWGDNPNGTNPDQFPNDSGEWFDSDSDGTGDNSDAFPLNANESADSDGDGVGDNTDQFDDDPLETIDSDGDGIGNNADACTYTYGNISTGNYVGCPDYDGDGYADVDDAFPTDSTQWLDSDGDGFGDNQSGNNPDLFKDLRSEWADSDGDGYGDNNQDKFPNDITQWSDIDGDGCGDNETGNNPDKFPALPNECADTDGDLVGDNADKFPYDANETDDSDGDGIGDNSDVCDGEPADIDEGPYKGCQDIDGDNYADREEPGFENDPNEWLDSDGDLVGDNADQCEDEAGTIGTLGCIDSDGDGWADKFDKYKSDPLAWSDGDGDNYTDQPGVDYSDDCPSQNGTSHITMKGCPDMDGDGIPDILDPDADGDGIFNTWEYQMDPMTDPFNASQTPADNDKDGVPDFFDEDDDNDGFPDDVEEQRGSDPFDANSDPLEEYGGGTFYVPGEGFSSQYNPDGIELSLGAFLNLLSSEFLAPLLIAPMTIYLMLAKKRRYKRIKNEIENADDLTQLEETEEEIDDLIGSNKLKIPHALLLRNILERQQDEFRGLTSTTGSVDQSMSKDLPEIARKAIPPPSKQPPPSSSPPKSTTGTVGKDGYEYTKWPANSSTQWYRLADSNAEWKKWK